MTQWPFMAHALVCYCFSLCWWHWCLSLVLVQYLQEIWLLWRVWLISGPQSGNCIKIFDIWSKIVLVCSGVKYRGEMMGCQSGNLQIFQFCVSLHWLCWPIGGTLSIFICFNSRWQMCVCITATCCLDVPVSDNKPILLLPPKYNRSRTSVANQVWPLF